MLLGLIVAIAIILLMLGVAAPRVAFELRREREVESVRRANQYVRAIQVYYRKFGRYPGSVEQLQNTNKVRYLRQQYIDPLTGKADYRLIGVGKNKTTVTGFFGAPLAGLPTAGLGSAAGMQSAGVGGSGAAGPGGVGGAFGAGGFGAGGFGAGAGNGAANGAANGTGAAAGGTNGAGANGPGGATTANGASGAAGATDNSGNSGSSNTGLGGASGLGSAAGMQSAGMPGSNGSTGPFMGVGSSANGSSIVEPNEQTQYQDWEFLYDPRIELLKAKNGINAGLGSVGAGALGAGNPMGTPGATSPFGSQTSPTSPAGATGGAGPSGTANPTQP
jgi:type II secretory pathway pseudopilin PulG